MAFARTLPTLPPPTELEWAYIAGLFDGEGSIVIMRYNPRGTRKTIAHQERLLVANTNLAILEWLRGLFGGYIHRSGSPLARHTPCYSWAIDGIRTTPILARLLPYLRIKHEQAVLVLEYRASIEQYRNERGRRRVALPPEELARRESICVRLREMKGRAPKAA